MKGLGFAGTCLLIVVAAGAVTSLLQFGIVALMLWGVLFRFRETLTFLAFLALLAFVNRYPWAFAAWMALALIVNRVKDRAERRPPSSLPAIADRHGLP